MNAAEVKIWRGRSAYASLFSLGARIFCGFSPWLLSFRPDRVVSFTAETRASC